MDLYSRLSYLFGTEEHLETRRQLVLLREYLMNQLAKETSSQILCSGSLGEGVAYPESDDDVLSNISDFRVVRTNEESMQANDLLMIYSDYSPAYCRLYNSINICLPSTWVKHMAFAITNMIWQDPFSYCDGSFGFIDLPSSISLCRQLGIRDAQYIHGPCISNPYGIIESDMAYGIQCSFWPDVANDWISKKRSHGWPLRETIQNIVAGGCHVVPIGDQDSPLCLHEWRISFSAAERNLMHSINHVQFLAYNLCRIALKRIIENKSPGVLCSYYIKTAFFYAIENKSTRGGQVDEFETCFKACLSVLHDFIDQKNCPSYFIPEYNMIKQKVNHTNCPILLYEIRSLYTAGLVEIIHLCGESALLKAPLLNIESNQDFLFMTSCHFLYSLLYFFPVLANLSNKELESVANILLTILSILRCGKMEKLIGIFLDRGLIFCSQILMNRLFNSQRSNKRNYSLHKSVELLLRIGYKGDVTTGKLTKATYMFCTGKTATVAAHTRRILSEYPPYAMNICSPDIINYKAYEEVMCSRAYSIDHKIRYAWVPPYTLSVFLLYAFPMALRMWISIDKRIIMDPLMYAYVMESLCNIRLRNHKSLMKSTRCMVNRIEHLHMILKAGGKMCVGIIKFEQGDSQSACRWLGSVYISNGPIFASIEIRRSALAYIACLLNKRFREKERKRTRNKTVIQPQRRDFLVLYFGALLLIFVHFDCLYDIHSFPYNIYLVLFYISLYRFVTSLTLSV